MMAAGVAFRKGGNHTAKVHGTQPSPSWFADTFGFDEEDLGYNGTQQRLREMQRASSDPTRALLRWIPQNGDNELGSKQELICGYFDTPTVNGLREECKQLIEALQHTENTAHTHKSIKFRWKNVAADVLELHADESNQGAVIQAASQFNCLEFQGPSDVPEQGITDYAWDHTQGPACAIACGAGTAFRNYLVEWVDDDGTKMLGQNRDHQLNTLSPLLQQLERIWMQEKRLDAPTLPCFVRNGYAQADSSNLLVWHETLRRHADELAAHIEVGVQSDTQVTYPKERLSCHPPLLVTQVYASAVPVAYGKASSESWEPLAQIVLHGVYEATLLAAIRQALRLKLRSEQPADDNHKCQRVYLTLVGGGVFGNEISWIYDAIWSASHSISQSQYTVDLTLDISVVHFRSIPDHAVDFIHRMDASNKYEALKSK